jgi:hypothetical protein
VTFSASYDRSTKIISALVCLFLVAVIADTRSLVFASIAVLLILVSYAYSPRGYVITERSILVQRLAGQPRIALDEVREARRATPDDLRRPRRLRGSGGGPRRSGALGTTIGAAIGLAAARSNPKAGK